jgi:hypothetical protein
MAYQGYRAPHDGTVGRNAATEPVKNGGELKTPPPVNLAPGGNPGRNGYTGASSANPGQKAGSANVNPQADTDAVMDAVIRDGAHGAQLSDDWQTRTVDDTPLPPAFGTRNRDSDGVATVPAKTGGSDFDPSAVRKPGA